jgi:hypothetical protein
MTIISKIVEVPLQERLTLLDLDYKNVMKDI